MKPLQTFIVIVSTIIIGSWAQDFTRNETITEEPPAGLNPRWRQIELDEFVPDVEIILKGSSGDMTYYEGYNLTLSDLAKSRNETTNSTLRREYKLSLILWKFKGVKGDSIIVKTDDGLPPQNWNWTSASELQVEVSGVGQISIEFEGPWANTSAVLHATVYFERENACPPEYFTCSGSDSCGRTPSKPEKKGLNFLKDLEVLSPNPMPSYGDFADIEEFIPDSQGSRGRDRSSEEEDDDDDRTGHDHSSGKARIYRCLLRSQKCNRRSNCGTYCSVDETRETCIDNYYYSDYDDYEYLGWYELQYLMTVLLAALFFIMGPILVVLFLFHFRKSRNAQIQAAASEVVTVRGYPNDTPPSYEDVHDIKTPPPAFDSVVVSLRSDPESTRSDRVAGPSSLAY